MSRFTLSGSLLASAFLGFAAVHAPADKPRDVRPPDVILEQLDDPWMPNLAPQGGIAGNNTIVFGNYTHVQVNVDANGNNIAGDAANEPSLAVDPTAPNRIAIGWRQFDTIASNFRQAGRAFTIDGGRNWNNPGPLDPGVFRSDPVLAAANDGTFYYYSLRNTFLCDMYISNDAGATFGAPIPAFGGDKAWVEVDNTSSPGAGHIYIAWSTAAGCCGGSTFSRSTNGGASFTTPIAIPMTPTFGTLDVDSDGNLYIFGVDAPSANNDHFVLARSSNAKFSGQATTFDQTTTVNMGGALRIGAAPNPSGLAGQAWVAVDRSGGANDGNIYVLATVERPPSAAAGVDPGDPCDVMFARSTDGGATFSPPVRLNDDPLGNDAYQWFGTMSVAPNGRIDVVFNDTRNSGDPAISELMYTTSSDGGLTWTANEVISPPFNSTVGWPQQNKLGDYYDMISDNVGAHLAWAATFSGEQDVYYTRIGDYDCNDNGVGDSEDIGMGQLTDCDGNNVPDQCEIAINPDLDMNEDGVLDACAKNCPTDLVSSVTFAPPPDGQVDGADLAYLLGEWGPNPGSLADFVTSTTFAPPPDGVVDGADLAVLLGSWGPCQ